MIASGPRPLGRLAPRRRRHSDLILAVTHAEDVHAPAVMAAVGRMGWRCVMLDLASLPRQTRLSFSAGRATSGASLIALDGSRIEAEEIAAVWWRRPRPFVMDPALSPPGATFAAAQVHAALSGIWGSLRAGWMNDPWRDERAGHKPAQLAAAEAVGLTVPPTLISSSPEDARAFLAEQGARPVIQKPLRATEADWRPTRLVTEADRRRLDDLRFAPAILQAYVAGTDVRVTAAGGRLLATAIDARDTCSPHDFRLAWHEARVAPFTLPDQVADRLRALLETLGLRYGAIDLRVTDEGEHVFLEVNPAGQWLFLEERTGQPMSQMVAEALAEAAAEGPREAAAIPRRRPPAEARSPAC